MIIFYNKKTGDIFGKIDGRVHDKHTLEKVIIDPGNIPKEDIGKYTVPFEPLTVVKEEPITELRVVDNKTMRVEEIVVGKKTVEKISGMEIKSNFSNIIYDVENGKKRIFDYKVKTNNDGEVVDILKK